MLLIKKFPFALISSLTLYIGNAYPPPPPPKKKGGGPSYANAFSSKYPHPLIQKGGSDHRAVSWPPRPRPARPPSYISPLKSAGPIQPIVDASTPPALLCPPFWVALKGLALIKPSPVNLLRGKVPEFAARTPS